MFNQWGTTDALALVDLLLDLLTAALLAALVERFPVSSGRLCVAVEHSYPCWWQVEQ